MRVLPRSCNTMRTHNRTHNGVVFNVIIANQQIIQNSHTNGTSLHNLAV